MGRAMPEGDDAAEEAEASAIAVLEDAGVDADKDAACGFDADEEGGDLATFAEGGAGAPDAFD